MDQALDHLSRISGFGRSAPLLILIVAANFAITACHTLQEWKGTGAPLWRYFGATVGFDVPQWLGFPVVYGGLDPAAVGARPDRHRRMVSVCRRVRRRLHRGRQRWQPMPAWAAASG
jgi:hypothetical protein